MDNETLIQSVLELEKLKLIDYQDALNYIQVILERAGPTPQAPVKTVKFIVNSYENKPAKKTRQASHNHKVRYKGIEANVLACLLQLGRETTYKELTPIVARKQFNGKIPYPPRYNHFKRQLPKSCYQLAKKGKVTMTGRIAKGQRRIIATGLVALPPFPRLNKIMKEQAKELKKQNEEIKFEKGHYESTNYKIGDKI